MRFLLACAVACLLWLSSSGARAQSEATTGRNRVAITSLVWKGNIPEGARELLINRLREGLTAAAFDVTAKDTNATTCNDASCFPALAQSLGVGYLVAGKVEEERKSYEITLELINGRTGSAIGSNHERCEICGMEDAAEKMGLAASALRARLEAHVRTPARFIIRSRPSGAQVSLDGAPAGRTPYDARLTGGEHHLSLTAPGFDPLDRSFSVVSGVDETLEYEMVRMPTKFPFKTAGWVAIATGALLVVGGIWALSSDSQEIACTPAEKDPQGDCPQLRATRGVGGVLVGAGAVMGTLGGVWLYLGSNAGTVGEPATAARAPGLRVGFQGRF
jgi:TolB-like protein